VRRDATIAALRTHIQLLEGRTGTSINGHMLSHGENSGMSTDDARSHHLGLTQFDSRLIAALDAYDIASPSANYFAINLGAEILPKPTMPSLTGVPCQVRPLSWQTCGTCPQGHLLDSFGSLNCLYFTLLRGVDALLNCR